MHNISIWINANGKLQDLNPNPRYVLDKTLNLEQIAAVIRNGGGVHGIEDIKPKIKFIQTHTKAEYQYRKLELPSFTCSGDFEYQRTANAKKVYNPIMGFDFDGLDVNAIPEKLAALKEWDGTKMVFVSPSGKGIKLFVVVDSNEAQHRLVYRCLQLYLAETFGFTEIETDTKCLDVSRICYFSYDPNLYYSDATYEIATSSLVAKYKAQAQAAGNINTNAEIVDFSKVDTTNIAKIFQSFVSQIETKGGGWKDRKRDSFLFEITKIKAYGVTLPECLSEVLNYVNGRYTSKYTALTIPQKVTRLWNNYLKNLKIKQPKKSDKIAVKNYLSEHNELIKSELLKKRTLYIDAGTGIGKTTLIKELLKELYKENGWKSDLIMPTTSLVEQQTDNDITTVTGNKALTDEQVKAAVLVTTYNSIGKLQKRNARILVIDEAHSLASDYSFKAKTIQQLQLRLEDYSYIIYLSGSILPLEGRYSQDNLLRFEKENNFKYQYNIVTLNKKPSKAERKILKLTLSKEAYKKEVTPTTDKDYFISNLEQGALNVFYKNDKEALENLYNLLTEKSYKVALVTKDQKERIEYKNIVENSDLSGYDILLTTCLIQSGINIKDVNRTVNITFASRSNLIDYVQFTARFRDNKPAITLMHSGKTGLIQLLDGKELADRVKQQISFLNQAKQVQESRDYGSTFANHKQIVKTYDMVITDTYGNYLTDEFYLLYENYKLLNENIAGNIRLLKHYLSLYNFTPIEDQKTEIDTELQKELTKKSRNRAKEKSDKKNSIVAEMLAGTYEIDFLDSGKDKVRKELEYKFSFLNRYKDVSDPVFKLLLTNDSEFKQFESRIAYYEAEKAEQAGERLEESLQVDYYKFKALKNRLAQVRTFKGLAATDPIKVTATELKEIVKTCGFTTTHNSYLKDSLGVLYHYSASANYGNYSLENEVDIAAMVTKASLSDTDFKGEFSDLFVSDPELTEVEKAGLEFLETGNE